MRAVAALFLIASSISAGDQFAPANSKWNRAIEPFRVVGNLYYVGAADVSSYLITTPEGHFLLDAGFRETAPMVEANVAKLGFRVADIRLLVVSHGHYDHVGGLAAIKARTGAKLLANPAEMALLSDGGKGDFAFGDRFAYPPVTADRPLRDGEQVRLGGTVLTAHFTPGHTKGCTSWTTTVLDGAKQLRVVIPCSMSAPDYQLVGNMKYPEIQQDFEKSIAKLRALPCDVFVALHSWDFELEQKLHARAADPGRNPFIDPAGYQRLLDRAQAALQASVAKQRAR